MNTLPSPSATGTAWKDRKLGLLLFGILSIILGVLSFCATLAMPLGLLMQQAVPPERRQVIDVRSIVVGVLTYLALSGLFIWVGIGSIRTRRWCRPIMLIIAWTWLICGTIGLIIMMAMLPDMFQVMRAQSGNKLPESFAWIMGGIMLGMGLVIYVLLPLAYVLFYRSPHVKATLEHYQPQPDWSDRRPTMVLGLALGAGLGGLMMPINMIYGAIPCFGVLLTGWSALAMYLALAAILLALAKLLWQQQSLGWWGLVILSILGSASAAITWFNQPFIEMYRHMGLPEQQIKMLEQSKMLNSSFLPWSIIVLSLVWLGFLIAVRKHFQGQSPRTA